MVDTVQDAEQRIILTDDPKLEYQDNRKRLKANVKGMSTETLKIEGEQLYHLMMNSSSQECFGYIVELLDDDIIKELKLRGEKLFG